MKKLHGIMPEMVAEPLAWGAYTEESDTYFFVCRFCELSEDIPDVSDFPALVAEMHKRGVSETGELGHPYITYSGRNPQFFPPSKSWEECFSKGLMAEFELEEGTHGPDEEMRRLRDGIMTKVIPRLLRPLETEDRTLVPRLVHGDLWDGNASLDVSTGHPMIFDAVPLYAHNECKLR
jgi:protein-ribulosamine 3-kinase